MEINNRSNNGQSTGLTMCMSTREHEGVPKFLRVIKMSVEQAVE